MPFPPPPPPGPPPPDFQPPSLFGNSNKSKSGDGRGELLNSIRQGTKLKKTHTNDKSAPVITGKVSGVSNNSDVGRTSVTANNANCQPVPNGMGLGGLFQGGMPKLRPTGRAIGGQSSVNTNASESVKNTFNSATLSNNGNGNSSLNEAIRKQFSGDIKNRGPPPQPPVPAKNSNISDSIDLSNPGISRLVLNKNSSLSNPQINISTLQNKNNGSFLHGSMSNSVSNLHTTMKPTISHGKPNLAPKPPGTMASPKPAVPVKKLNLNGRLSVSRAQSMRVPRSPPIAPPTNPSLSSPIITGKDFGTIRGVPTALHQSQENLITKQHTHMRNQTLPENLIHNYNKNTAPIPPVNSRPSAPPPSRPPVPPPPSRMGLSIGLKPPLSPPPPPPVLAPATAPPPPPHRTPPAVMPQIRLAPNIPQVGPPPPPVRNSSMRNGNLNNMSPILDFDTRFANLFHPVIDFPQPITFQGLHKMYTGKNNMNKQQAPLPPNAIQLGIKLWDSSTC